MEKILKKLDVITPQLEIISMQREGKEISKIVIELCFDGDEVDENNNPLLNTTLSVKVYEPQSKKWNPSKIIEIMSIEREYILDEFEEVTQEQAKKFAYDKVSIYDILLKKFGEKVFIDRDSFILWGSGAEVEDWIIKQEINSLFKDEYESISHWNLYGEEL